MALVGPGTVPHKVVRSFKVIADLCEQIKDKEEITIHGDLVKLKKGGDYIFEGKKVIFLFDATYKDQFMEVDRR